MKKEEMQKLTESIQNKVGKESSGLIADDIGMLLTDNSSMLSIIDSQKQQIERLKQDKENLITTNGNLLQQISMGEDTSSRPNKEENKKEEVKNFSFKTAFDSQGRFKK